MIIIKPGNNEKTILLDDLLLDGKEQFGDYFEEVAIYVGKRLYTEVSDMNNALNLIEELYDLYEYKFG